MNIFIVGKRETEVVLAVIQLLSMIIGEKIQMVKHGKHQKYLNDIRDYNIDDCDSTQELVDWLRKRQKEHKIAYLGKTEVIEPEQ